MYSCIIDKLNNVHSEVPYRLPQPEIRRGIVGQDGLIPRGGNGVIQTWGQPQVVTPKWMRDQWNQGIENPIPPADYWREQNFAQPQTLPGEVKQESELTGLEGFTSGGSQAPTATPYSNALQVNAAPVSAGLPYQQPQYNTNLYRQQGVQRAARSPYGDALNTSLYDRTRPKSPYSGSLSNILSRDFLRGGM